MVTNARFAAGFGRSSDMREVRAERAEPFGFRSRHATRCARSYAAGELAPVVPPEYGTLPGNSTVDP